MESWFKVAFAVHIVLFIVILTPVARLLRSRPGGRLNQLEHEMPLLRTARTILGLVGYLALFDWLLPGTRMPWARVDLPLSVRWVGAVLMLCSLWLLRSSYSSLGRNYRGGIGLWDDHELVQSGPYRLVRHPIYVAFVVKTVGLGLLSASWLLGSIGVVLTLGILVLRSRVEEEELAERFEGAYVEYRASTKRFLPWLF